MECAEKQSPHMNVRGKLSNELHKVARVNFRRRNYELKSESDLFQADLIDMSNLSKYNSNFKFILAVINCFTKFAFCVAIKTKSASSVFTALEPIIRNNKMKLFQTDQGTEFFNSKIKALLDKYNIKHYHVFTDKKAAICERFIRSFKSRIYKYLTQHTTKRWVDALPKLLNEYNGSFHRSIQMCPNDFRKKHRSRVIAALNKAAKANLRLKSKRVMPKYKLGDIVRISKYKQIFDKSYNINWSTEYFIVHSVFPSIPPTYILRDQSGEIISGRFYEEEMLKTRLNTAERDIYLVEKVIKRKGNKLFVKWLGFPPKFNSWVNKNSISL